MSNLNLEETRPIPLQEDSPDEGGKKRWWLWALVGIIGLAIVVGLSAYEGYRSGIQQRLDKESTETSKQAEEQFELGLRDLEAGLYDVARQRFEFVIQLDPDYPGVTDRLAEVLLALNVTATATPVPTPTLTPTPDLRGAEDMFFQAERLLAEENWTAALETLDTLRKKQPDYRAIDVDGMYYVALRNRGVSKIGLDGNLEGGIYDLTRAERFGPLDVDADSWRTWARLYISGASFWDVNWPQAISIFSELAFVAPNIHDTSHWTATERLRSAYIRYGDQLALAEEWCQAEEQYEAALEIGPDPNLEPTATEVSEECSPPTDIPEPPTPTPEVTSTPELAKTPIATETPSS